MIDLGSKTRKTARFMQSIFEKLGGQDCVYHHVSNTWQRDQDNFKNDKSVNQD